MAILRFPPNNRLTAVTSTCDSVDEALDWFKDEVGESTVDAAGIDAPLSWATGRAGWRSMDIYLRKRYRPVQRSVLSINSAAGSMVVQGMAVALKLKKIWKGIRLNETHPKVLYYALTGHSYKYGQPMVRCLLGRFTPPLTVPITNEHEWDALFSAWATWQGLDGGWANNLMKEAKGLLFPAGPVSYFWPPDE